jgi:hypothetical protein
MDSNIIKRAIESGFENHNIIRIETGVDLNTDSTLDSTLISRTMAAFNLIKEVYGLSGEKFIITNEETAKRLISPQSIIEKTLCGYMGKAFGIDVYAYDELVENYVCVGCKDNLDKSYTFIIG